MAVESKISEQLFVNRPVRNGSFFQPRFTINQPNDIYEQEADAVAENVMRMPDSKAESSFFQPKPMPLTPVQRKCSHCEEEEEKVQMKSAASASGGMTAPSIVNNVINSGGQPFDRSTRNFMESRFGYDFGNVQIHNDPLAHQSSKDINALAYTHGNHIVFANNKYDPDTDSGKRLLAHELTHVVQQVDGIQRTISYDSKGKEEYIVNPAINIMKSQLHMGKTKPTMNSNEFKKGTNPLRDPKYSFTDEACKFEDITDILSYKMDLPIKTEWKTMITVDDAKKMLAPTQRDSLDCDLGQIPLVVKGDPDNKSRAEEIRKHELGHVGDLKKLYDKIFLPWSKTFAAKVSKGSLSAAQKEDCLKEFYKGMDSKDSVYTKFIKEFFELDAAYHKSTSGKTTQPKIQEFTCKRIEFKL